MAKRNELINRINRKYSSMSKGQRAIANYILSDPEHAVFLTASELGNKVCVSESTVVRFASFMGYRGYPAFVEALEKEMLKKLDLTSRSEMNYEKLINDDEKDRYAAVMHSDAAKIEDTLSGMDTAVFDQAVDIIDGARRIYVIGIRSCAPLANAFSFNLGLIYDDVRLLSSTNMSEIFEQMINISAEDVIIGISFPRYSMRTLKALEFANSRSASVITLTDSVNSPMNLYSSCNLIAKSDMATIVDSLVAPLSLINAVCVPLFVRHQSEVSKKMETLNELWDEYSFYDNDELDVLSSKSNHLGNN